MGRLPIVSAIAALAALTSLGGGICASQTLAATTASSKAQAVGYAEAGSTTTTQVAASRGVLTTVTVDGVNLTSNGGGLTAVSAESLALLKAAHAQKKKAELLVGNFDGSIGDFSPAIGDRLLGSAAHITGVVDKLTAEVTTHRWDGITVDLENLTDKHPAALTSLVSMLNAKLGLGKSEAYSRAILKDSSPRTAEMVVANVSRGLR